MDKEKLKESKKQAEEYLHNTLLPQKEQVANAIQQVIGRVQTLDELIAAPEEGEEVVDATVVDENPPDVQS